MVANVCEMLRGGGKDSAATVSLTYIADRTRDQNGEGAAFLRLDVYCLTMEYCLIIKTAMSLEMSDVIMVMHGW